MADKVLIADDEADIVAGVEDTLAREGYEVIAAADGKDFNGDLCITFFGRLDGVDIVHLLLSLSERTAIKLFLDFLLQNLSTV